MRSSTPSKILALATAAGELGTLKALPPSLIADHLLPKLSAGGQHSLFSTSKASQRAYMTYMKLETDPEFWQDRLEHLGIPSNVIKQAVNSGVISNYKNLYQTLNRCRQQFRSFQIIGWQMPPITELTLEELCALSGEPVAINFVIESHRYENEDEGYFYDCDKLRRLLPYALLSGSNEAAASIYKITNRYTTPNLKLLLGFKKMALVSGNHGVVNLVEEWQRDSLDEFIQYSSWIGGGVTLAFLGVWIMVAPALLMYKLFLATIIMSSITLAPLGIGLLTALLGSVAYGIKQVIHHKDYQTAAELGNPKPLSSKIDEPRTSQRLSPADRSISHITPAPLTAISSDELSEENHLLATAPRP
jgi:hypothetical protein